MKIFILDKTKKKKFIESIGYLGVEKIPYLLIKSGKERVRAFSGSFSNEEIMTLWRLLPIEGVGLYIGKEHINRSGLKEVRLSIDSLHILKDQIKSNIFELDGEHEKLWFKGKDLEISNARCEGFVAVKSKGSGDYIGTGRISHDKKMLFNFLPKERRVKD